MTKTFAKVVSQSLTILVLLAMKPYCQAVDRAFVLNFEFVHWNLFVICYLVIGIFIEQAILVNNLFRQ